MKKLIQTTKNRIAMKRLIVPILKNDLDFELSSFIVVMRELNVEIKKIMLSLTTCFPAPSLQVACA